MADQQPVETITHGDVTASVWRNTNEEGTKAYYSLTVSRRYDKDGESKFTGNIGRWDLEPLEQCIRDARAAMDRRMQEDRDADQSAAA